MNFNNEEELIKLIKNKTIIEIKELLLNSHINLENLNYFRDTLFYLISNNYSHNAIKILIKIIQIYFLISVE